MLYSCRISDPEAERMLRTSSKALDTGKVHTCIPYSQKYWRELNLAVEPKIAIARILVNLNLAVWYGIAICMYANRKFWQILIRQLQYRLPNRQI